jgi:DNA-binding CsgD family transcriptional regulator
LLLVVLVVSAVVGVHGGRDRGRFSGRSWCRLGPIGGGTSASFFLGLGARRGWQPGSSRVDQVDETARHQADVVVQLPAFRPDSLSVRLNLAHPRLRLVSGIRIVADGGSLFAPAVTRRLIERFAGTAPPEPPPVLAELTPRELEVLRLLGRGLSNGEIAAELVVSERTAKTHVAHILTKLDLRDRVQAVVLAYEGGIVPVRTRS